MKLIEGKTFLFVDGSVIIDDKDITNVLRAEGHLTGNTLNNVHIKVSGHAIIKGSLRGCKIEAKDVQYK